MTRTSPPQVAFSSGELDPLLHRRYDYQRFQTGLAKCRGFLPLPQGGFTRAPGTIFRGVTRGNAQAVMIPFQFAADDALTLEFTPGWMRVWRYGALVQAGGAPYELATPFDAASLARLQWVQSADVIYLADGLRPIQRLARYALDDWTIGPQVFDKGPFRVQNIDKSLTLQASATTGTVTLTASAPFFEADHVGMLMMLKPTTNTTVPVWAPEEAVGEGSFRRYGGRTYQLTFNDRADDIVGSVPPTHEEGEEVTTGRGRVKWLFIDDQIGIARISAITSATQATVTVLKTIPKGCVDDPTYRWSEGAWCDRYGYPAALEIYDQRLVAAATPADPRTVWFSVVGDFADFEPGTEDDDAFAYTISGSGSINRIQHVTRGPSGLHIFALGEEHSARSDTRQQVIGPTTAKFSVDSGYGSAPARPITPDGTPIFITRDQQRVMLIGYSLDQDRNVAQPLSLPARHLGASGFLQIAWQGAPQRIAWLRRGSGDLAAMIYDASEEVLGWATLPAAGGFVEAISVSPDASGTADIVTLVVRRVIAGQTVRMIEELAPVYGALAEAGEIADAVHFFACAQIAAAPATASFSLPHLAGQTVYAWTDRGQFGPLTVAADGAVVLPVAVSAGSIGLFDATHEAETLDIQAAAPDGNSTGRRKRLHSGIGVGLYRTAQGFMQAVERDFAQAERRSAPSLLVKAPVAADLARAFSGVTTFDQPSGHAHELALRVTPFGGAPLTVTAIVPIVQEAGR